MKKRCECSSQACDHRNASCRRKNDLALYCWAGITQTLCEPCAYVVEQFCDAYCYRFQKLERETAVAGQRKWTRGDWGYVGVLLLAVGWIVIEIAPAFFDGRVAQVVGR